MKKKEILYAVENDLGNERECETKKELLEEIKDEMLGTNFKIYKVTIIRELVKTIDKKKPRPCYGGWGKGHTIPDGDFKNEVPFTFCKRCGYLMKLIYKNFTEPNYVLATPRVHKNDKLICKKCGERFHPKKSLHTYLCHIGNCNVRKRK
ncbi:MAG: hypothetical protein K5790_10295 [Nitrosopumilus sp.]|uniref:hypothetical protein n=1 Tax=Nitrosopumilus sp. TaxID=2024843 RepID=UPI00247DAF08|nr:hypothetical protein [Nitrosopumilus sp.]MCV0393659.1 hypothetical protein [Nitrosopumilus sp.]